MEQASIDKLDDLTNRLEARINSIQVNIKFGEQFANYQLEGENVYKMKLKESIEEQKKYKQDVEEMREKLKKFKESGAKDLDKSITDNKQETELVESAESLFIDKRFNTTLEVISEHRNKTNLDYDSKIRDFDESLDKLVSRNETENINLVVLGQRGSGKSTFINSIFGVDHYKAEAIKTDANECTLEPNAYTALSFGQADENSKSTLGFSDKFVVWDYPGVGTHRFPTPEYRAVIPILPVDAYIYLYQGRLEKLDVDVLNEIKEKIVFLVRTKADEVFNLFNFTDSLEDVDDKEKIKELIDAEWQKTKMRTKNNDPSIKKQLESISDLISKKFYMISCLNDYREYYDFIPLMSDMVQKLPSEKMNFLMTNLKINCSVWFLKKSLILKSQISTWIPLLLHELEEKGMKQMLMAFISKIFEIYMIFGIEPNMDILDGTVFDALNDHEFSSQLDSMKNFLSNLNLSTVMAKDLLLEFTKFNSQNYRNKLLKKYAPIVKQLEEVFNIIIDKRLNNSIGHVLTTN